MQLVRNRLHINSRSQIVDCLKAIAHPVRLSVIQLLSEGNRLNVTEIYLKLGLEQAVVSQHLSILKDKNILNATREGKHKYYFLRDVQIITAIDLITQACCCESSDNGLNGNGANGNGHL